MCREENEEEEEKKELTDSERSIQSGESGKLRQIIFFFPFGERKTRLNKPEGEIEQKYIKKNHM